MTPTKKREALAAHIRNCQLITAPGVYDMISVRIADRQNHPALYMTGYGTVASYLGLPDAGLASYTDMVHRAGQMAAEGIQSTSTLMRWQARVPEPNRHPPEAVGWPSEGSPRSPTRSVS
ncbi:MAG: hypothetical protein VCB07_02535, partial [Gammaproteobacteria bacterium]